MQLKNEKITLRHIKESDIENYIHWTTVETDWMNWDAPWEWIEDPDPTSFVEWQRTLLNNPTDGKLEIETRAGKHIGWCNSYYVDDDKEKLAIGIDIPSLDARGKGYAFSALTLFMKHLFAEREILYTQTWSGNLPMIALAKKLGFTEVRRLKDLREINGKKYDSLTFAITKEGFLTHRITNPPKFEINFEEFEGNIDYYFEKLDADKESEVYITLEDGKQMVMISYEKYKRLNPNHEELKRIEL